jgi:hypothetical protein
MFVPLLLSLLAALPQDGGSLRHDLEQARALVVAGDGAAAHARVMKLLEDHEGSEELLRHLPSVQEVLLESLFLEELAVRAAAQAAEVGEIPELPFRAEVVSYKEKGGKFQLRWEGEEQLLDLPFDDGLLTLPLDLDGKFRVGVELTSYPDQGVVQVLFENADGVRYEVGCGIDAGGLNYQVARAFKVTGERNEILNRSEKKLPKPGKRMMLNVKSLGSKIQVLDGMKRFIDFKTERGQPIGRISFRGIDPGTLIAVEYDGPVDASSMASLIAAKRDRERIAFRQGVDLTAEMPEWAHPYLQAKVFDLDGVTPPGVEGVESSAEAWEWAEDLIRKSRTEYFPIQVLSLLQDSPHEDLPTVQVEYASLRVAYEGGYWEDAMGHARNVLRFDPDHGPTKRLQLEVTARHGDGGRTWELAMEHFQADPEDPTPVVHAVLLLMQLDMLDDLRNHLKEDRILPEVLKKRCEDILSHRENPRGTGMRTYSLNRIEITSDLPRDEGEALGDWIADEVRKATNLLPDGTLSKSDKLRVILFADRWDYEEFTSEVLGMAHPSAAGFFSPAYDAVIAFRHPVEQVLHDSLRREVMIHVGKRIHPEYPVWACVGLSELVADGSMDPGIEVKKISLRSSDLFRVAMKEEVIGFGHMLHMSAPGYYALESERSMEAQAWLTSMMLAMMGEWVEVDMMDSLIEGPRSGKTWAETVDDIFTQTDSANYYDKLYLMVIDRIRHYLVR